MSALTDDKLHLVDTTGDMTVEQIRQLLNMLAERYPALLERNGRKLLLHWAELQNG